MRSRASTSRRSEFTHSATPNMPRNRRKQSVSHSRKACRTVSVSQWLTKRVPERFQLAPQLHVVVNFAVENDGGVAVGAGDRLVAAFKIDDLQAGCS